MDSNPSISLGITQIGDTPQAGDESKVGHEIGVLSWADPNLIQTNVVYQNEDLPLVQEVQQVITLLSDLDSSDLGFREEKSKESATTCSKSIIKKQNKQKGKSIEVATSSRLPDKKHPKQKWKKAKDATKRPSLPKGMKYVIKQIPKHSLRFGIAYNANFKSDLEKSIGDEGIALFRQTVFGHYLDMPPSNIQAQIIKCLLFLEIEQNNPDELHVLLHFTIKEFALITGLKCSGNAADFRYPHSPPSRLLEKYFPGAVSSVIKGRLIQRFLMGNWDNIEDAVQMGILYFIHTFLYSQTCESPIPIDDFRMVEDGRYEHFPWGQSVFTKLMKSFRQDTPIAKKLYRLSGMPYALIVWIYECASKVDEEIVVKVGSHIPRILNWQVVAPRPLYKTFMATIFTKIDCTNLVPTVEELAALDLNDNVSGSIAQAATSSIPTPSNMKPKQVVLNEPTGFEDFSTNPLEHILRKSKRIVETFSPPPPKRRCVVQPKKSIQDGADKLKKTKHPSLIAKKSNTNTEVPGPSRPSSELHVNLVKVKRYIKKYIDKRFNALEELIKTNHIEVLKAISNGVHTPQKNMSGLDRTVHLVEQQTPFNVTEQSFKEQNNSDALKPQEDVQVANILFIGTGLAISSSITKSINAQESTSVPSKALKQHINTEDVESTFHTVQSFLKSLPEQYPSQQSGLQSNTTSSAQTLAKLIFDCSIRLPLEALAHDPTNEKEMHGAIAALNENPSSLFSDEQAKQLVKLKYEFPIMVKKWRDLAQSESSYQKFLTNFEEDRKKLDIWIRSEARLKAEYDKREEQARELEELLQDIKTRQKEIMDERQEGSREAQKLVLLAQEKAGKIDNTSNELLTTKMQMDGLRKSWSNFQSTFP